MINGPRYIPTSQETLTQHTVMQMLKQNVYFMILYRYKTQLIY